MIFGICVSIVTVSETSEAADNTYSKPNLTQEEIIWLDQHPKIMMGSDHDWPPFDFIAPDGTHQGYHADLVMLLNQRLGNRIQIVADSWDTLIEKVKNKQLDGLMGPATSEERRQFLLFTKPYYFIPNVLIVRKDNQTINKLSDFTTQTLAMEKGDSNIPEFRKLNAGLHIKEVENNLAILTAVSSGEVDAGCLSLSAASYLIHSCMISNLKVASDIPGTQGDIRLGTRNDWPLLSSILDKTLDSIDQEEYRRLQDKWISLQPGSTTLLKLTPAENSWLHDHPVVTIAINASGAPIEFVNNQGLPAGILSEYFKFMERILNITIKTVPCDDLAKRQSLMSAGKVDLISDSGVNPDGMIDAASSNPLVSFPVAIFTKSDRTFSSLTALNGKIITLVRGRFNNKDLPVYFPEITVIWVETPREALTLIANNKAAAYVDAIPVGSHAIASYGFNNIHVAGNCTFSSSLRLAAVKKDAPIISIINKAVATLSGTEQERFASKWSTSLVMVQTDYSMLLAVSSVAFLIIVERNRFAE